MSTNFIEYNPEDIDDKIVIKENLKAQTPNFIWRIKFSTALNRSTVNNVTMFVTSEQNIPLDSIISYNEAERTIDIRPLEEYVPGQTYILNITTALQSATGVNLKKPVSLHFKVK